MCGHLALTAGQYKEAEEAALNGPTVTLQHRLLFHVAHKMNDEHKLMVYHQKLEETLEDLLCLAAIHFSRSHYQEATDIYKRILLENQDYVALNVYVALCYYKLDYFGMRRVQWSIRSWAIFPSCS